MLRIEHLSKTFPGQVALDDVTLEGGKLTIEDKTSGKKVVLPASKTL